MREVRANFSRYLDLVVGGTEVIVTNHGKVVARLCPPEGRQTLDDLIESGLATAPTRRARYVPRPVDVGATVSDLVAEQRR